MILRYSGDYACIYLYYFGVRVPRTGYLFLGTVGTGAWWDSRVLSAPSPLAADSDVNTYECVKDMFKTCLRISIGKMYIMTRLSRLEKVCFHKFFVVQLTISTTRGRLGQNWSVHMIWIETVYQNFNPLDKKQGNLLRGIGHCPGAW